MYTLIYCHSLWENLLLIIGTSGKYHVIKCGQNASTRAALIVMIFSTFNAWGSLIFLILNCSTELFGSPCMQLRWVLLHKIWQENFIRQCALYKELQSLVFGIAASRWWFTDLNDDLLMMIYWLLSDCILVT